MALQQGIFVPRNPKKYKGNNIHQITFRSGWELKVMTHFDVNPNVLEWSSECVVVPYISPIDQRTHRYFPDFLAKLRKKDGSIKTYLYEVKPHAQTIEPQKKSRITKKYINEVYTWGVNSSKWQAAMQYCDKMGWEFAILTEKDLFQ